MNRKFQEFLKIEKPLIAREKNSTCANLTEENGIISSPTLYQTSSYYSNYALKDTLTLIYELTTSILLTYFSIHFCG